MFPNIKINYFINRWYGSNTNEFISNNNLLYSSDANLEKLKGYNNLSNGILFSATNNFHDDVLNQDSVVIGGPCLSDCYDSITLEAALEIMNVVEISKILKAEGIIFLGDNEEMLQHPEKDWKSITDNIEKYIKKACDFKEYHEIKIIRTSSEDIQKNIASFRRYVNNIPNTTLNNLYRFKNCFNDVSKRNDNYYKSCRNTITTYLPPFVETITSKSQNVIVSENSHQINAVSCAISIMKKFTNSNHGPYHLVHLPVPDIKSNRRMHRSSINKKIFLDDNDKSLQHKLNIANEKSLNYWISAIPTEISSENNNMFDCIRFLRNLQK
jgi:hypothetical protein